MYIYIYIFVRILGVFPTRGVQTPLLPASSSKAFNNFISFTVCSITVYNSRFVRVILAQGPC